MSAAAGNFRTRRGIRKQVPRSQTSVSATRPHHHLEYKFSEREGDFQSPASSRARPWPVRTTCQYGCEDYFVSKQRTFVSVGVGILRVIECRFWGWTPWVQSWLSRVPPRPHKLSEPPRKFFVKDTQNSRCEELIAIPGILLLWDI